MQKLLLIVTILFVIRSNSQDFSDTVISVLSGEKYISHVRSNPLLRGKILSSPYNADTIDFGVVVYHQSFNSHERKKGHFPQRDQVYQIEAYTLNDTIFFKRVEKIIQGAAKKMTPMSMVDTSMLLTFITKHNFKYQSTWTLGDFLNFSSNYGSYSFLCGGMFPKITKQAYSLVNLVNQKDTSFLKNLASSFSAEERAYGSSGLAFIQLKGTRISRELSNLISANQESKTKIYYCEGCVSGTMTLDVALSASRLKAIYEYLVYAKLL